MTDVNVASQDVDAVEFYPVRREFPLHPSSKLLDRLTTGPVERVEIWDGSSPWLVTRLEDFKTVLADRPVSSDPRRPGFPGLTKSMGAGDQGVAKMSFIAMDGEEHARHRRMLTPLLSVRKVEAWRPEVREIIKGLIAEMHKMSQPVDLVANFSMPFASKVLCLIMGLPDSFHVEFQAFGDVFMRRDTTPEQLGAATERLHSHYPGFIQDKREDPQEDILSVLVVKMDAGELDEEQLIGMLDLLVLGGHETTAKNVSLGLIAMMQQPDQLALLRDSDDPAVLKNAVEDILRFVTTSFSGRRRVATEDFELGGQQIKAGEGLIACADVANRDGLKFDNPNQLDFTRAAHGHAAFGFGPHQCIGQALARTELQEAFRALLDELPAVRLGVPFQELNFLEDQIIYGVETLPLVWTGGEQ